MKSDLSNVSDLFRSPLSFARPFDGGALARFTAVLVLPLAAGGLLALAAEAKAQNAGTLTTIHQFAVSQGIPSGDLILGSDGNFYGTTVEGGSHGTGTVFRVTPAGTLTTLHGFEPADPFHSVFPSTLLQGRDGSFYGTTNNGGDQHVGSVFRVTPAGNAATLHSFEDRPDSVFVPYSSALAQGSDGNFYGTTRYDGTRGDGSVFRVTPAGNLTTLYSFAAGNEFSVPSALLAGPDGNFYGTTQHGGSSDLGTFYRITPAGVQTTLHHFKGDDGSYPTTVPLLGRDGNFYGVTGAGGTSELGTFYRLTPAGALTTLHNANLADDAKLIYAFTLLQGRDGNFYGTTTYSSGSIFRYTPAGELTILYNFDRQPDNGESVDPSGLVQGRDGNFYGTTAYGGNRNGTIFRFTLTLPVINSPTSAAAQVGEAFSYQITATNNPASYRAGGLPAGLSVGTATGKITGAPTAAGTFNVALAATNDGGTGTATLVLTVKPAPLTITSSPNPPIRAGVAFSYQITATNNPTSFHTHGLPEGLGLSTTTGKISGTPTMAGTYAVTMSATNNAGTATAPLNLVVKAPALVITSNLEPPSRQGVAFAYQITASQTPTSFHTRGLPAGLGLSTTTGKITGKPTKAGTYTVALSVANSSGSGAATLTLVVKPPVQ